MAFTALLAVCELAASEHHGQVTFGGLPVPGATITASQGDKRFTAVTDQQGVYRFPDLPDGTWTIRVEMLCFETITREVAVTPDAPGAIWELKLQSLDEIKAAAGPAASASASQPASSASAVAVDSAPSPAPSAGKAVKSSNRSAKNAPAATSGQSSFQRADVRAAGTTPAPDAAPLAPAEANQAPSDGLLINGSVNNGAASPFAQSAAFGNNRRGGRSLYTGSLGVILNNSALDARAFSLTGQNTPTPQNLLTGLASFGGPLKIPHLFNARNAPNFFVNYQWKHNRVANALPGTMPTLDERGGDLSQLAGPLGQPLTVIDPANGQPFPGNQIPANRISPQARALLTYYPLPAFNGSRYNYQTAATTRTDQNALQARLNKSFGMKNQVFGSFAYQGSSVEAPNLFNFVDHTDTTGIRAPVSWNHRINQRLFFTLTYDFSRLSTSVLPYFAHRANVSGEAGITGNNQDPANWGPPSLSFTNFSGLSDAQNSVTHNQTSAFSFSGLWNRSPHTIQFGGDFRRQQFNVLAQQNARGTFTFTGAATGADTVTGSDFADFLLGIPDASQIAFGNADKYFRGSSYDAYVIDDWRVNPGFTVNIGVRWEYWSPLTELYGRLVNLDVTPGFAAEAPVVAQNPVGSLTGQRYPDSLINPDKHAFQPRVAIAWHPFLGSSLTIRAGYGVYYNTSIYQQIAINMAQQSPLSKSLSVQNSPSNPLTLANGFSASPNITTDTFGIDPNFRVGYAQNWNLVVQRDLPGGMLFTATYLGIKGTRAVQQFLPNTYPLGAVNPCPACLAGYTYMTSNGNSTREAGQLQLRRRLHNGFTATLQYTYAKAIDDAALGGNPLAGGSSTAGARSTPAAVTAQNWLDLSAERGLSTFDQRHTVTVQAQYSTGAGLRGGTLLDGWRGAVFKDWTFLANLTAGSGLPLTPSINRPVNGTGQTGPLRPDYTGLPVYQASGGAFLNSEAYVPPPLGYWGNAGRNTITGPAQFSFDASMARTFRLGDRLNADLRFDSTNVLNHVTYTSWYATLGTQFGLPTSAGAMRVMQATFRVRF